MALFVCFVYEDGTRTSLQPVELSDDGSPAQVQICSITNGTVMAIEVFEDDKRVSVQSVNMFLRVVDAIEVTIVPPDGGWPDGARTYFSKEVDEQAVIEMRQNLQAMRDKLRYQQQVLVREAKWP